MADRFSPSSPSLVDFFSHDIFHTFLETYPTTLHSSPPSFGQLRVFWSHDDHQPIQDKIRCAFQNLQVDYFFTGLIQFWAPVSVCGRQHLTTSDQPFTLATLDNGLGKYRLCSLKYQYGVDVINSPGVEEDVGIISDGAAGRAFLNKMPELLPDMKVSHQGSPLVSFALGCGLMSCVMVPVFDPCQSCCIGVVECSASSSTEFLQVFNNLNTSLEKEGLTTFHAPDCLPYKTIPALEHAKNEIDDALKIIWHTHGLAFAHVWIAYKDENQESLEDGRAKRVIGLKLTDYSVDLDDEHSRWLEVDCTSYHNACYRLPLKMWEGLIGETFQNYKPYFVEDISELSDDESVLKLLSRCFECSCFVIYLRSTKTSDLDYVFEFFWRKGRDSVILLESLLLTFKRYLPSFKFDSGVEFGDEIDILDVRDSIGKENKYMKIFQRKTSLKRGRQSEAEVCLMPLKARGKTTPIELSREQIESQFGQTQEKAAKKLNVNVSTLKRKCKKFGIKWKGEGYVEENQSDTNEEEDKGGAIQDNTGEASLDKNMVTIKAKYGGDLIMFTHPMSSATSKAIEKEIVKRFKLDPSTHYKLKYFDDEDKEWILFTCDEDVTLFQKDKRKVRVRLLTRNPSHT